LSRNITIVFVIIALLLGFLAALVAKRYIDDQTARSRTAGAGGAVQVLVARNDIPVAAVLTPSDVTRTSVPRSIVPRGALTDPKMIEGRGASTAILQGELVTESRLTPKGVGGGLAAMITEGYRAVTVKVNEVVGVAGFIVPGSRVDVLTTIRPQEGAPGTKMILQNVRVLAAGPYLQQDRESKPVTVSAVTLELLPEQAEMVAHAQNEGEIRLALRSSIDTEDVPTPGTNTASLLGSRRRGAAPSSDRGIEVVLGTHVTHQKF
jgi:pilus assembly protein CpaB